MLKNVLLQQNGIMEHLDLNIYHKHQVISQITLTLNVKKKINEEQ